VDPESHRAATERWREHRMAALHRSDGWLALAGLVWLRDGSNSVGSDASCDVVLPEGPPHAGSVVVREGRATLLLASEAGPGRNGEAATVVDLRDDLAGDPTSVQVGPLRLTVINREGQLAIRVWDPDRPRRFRVTRVDHYPVDIRWRVEARLEPDSSPPEVLAPTVVGPGQAYPVLGRMVFEHEGATHGLLAYDELGAHDPFIVFGDLTNADETYGGGRYLYAEGPDESGRVVLDFNRAYNPPCVFTPYTVCALAMPGNRLPFRVEAGEKRFASTSSKEVSRSPNA